MIEIQISDSACMVKGHAGTAPKGKDLVCAAVSAEVYGLLHNLLNEVKEQDVTFEMENGYSYIACTASKNNRVRALFQFKRREFEMLAKNYPNAIKLIGGLPQPLQNR